MGSLLKVAKGTRSAASYTCIERHEFKRQNSAPSIDGKVENLPRQFCIMAWEIHASAADYTRQDPLE